MSGIGVRTVEVNAEDVMKEFPSWFPNNERIFQLYLMRHPEIVAEDAQFMAFEVYYVDLLFMGADKFYVVEAKHIRKKESAQTEIDKGLIQLERGCRIVYSFAGKEGKLVVPVLALMIGQTVDSPKSNTVRLKLQELRRLDDEIADRIAEKENLERQINRLKREYERLERKYEELKELVSEMRQKPSIRRLEWDAHIYRELQVELERWRRTNYELENDERVS